MYMYRMYDILYCIVCIIIYLKTGPRCKTLNIIMPIQDDKMQDIFYILCTCSMQ